mmetsp:Transcript_15061/g.44396  ORF Transcript_15061/g.44396 Transcript_15061/m.44396 type:complete len:202 (-) Transcript_15061:190-795(-)
MIATSCALNTVTRLPATSMRAAARSQNVCAKVPASRPAPLPSTGALAPSPIVASAHSIMHTSWLLKVGSFSRPAAANTDSALMLASQTSSFAAAHRTFAMPCDENVPARLAASVKSTPKALLLAWPLELLPPLPSPPPFWADRIVAAPHKVLASACGVKSASCGAATASRSPRNASSPSSWPSVASAHTRLLTSCGPKSRS